MNVIRVVMSARSCKNQLHKSMFCVKLLPHFGNKRNYFIDKKVNCYCTFQMKKCLDKSSTLDSICEILPRYFLIQGRLLCVYLVSAMYELSFLANAHSLESLIF